MSHSGLRDGSCFFRGGYKDVTPSGFGGFLGGWGIENQYFLNVFFKKQFVVFHCKGFVLRSTSPKPPEFQFEKIQNLIFYLPLISFSDLFVNYLPLFHFFLIGFFSSFPEFGR